MSTGLKEIRRLDTPENEPPLFYKGDNFETSCLLTTHQVSSGKLVYSKRNEFAFFGRRLFSEAKQKHFLGGLS